MKHDCIKCGQDVPSGDRVCSYCGQDNGFPNAREALGHREDLYKRYETAKKRLPDGIVKRLEEIVLQSEIVVNCSIDVEEKLIDKNQSYKNWHMRKERERVVDSDDEGRERTDDEYRKRTATETKFFFSYRRQVIYAAINPGSPGLKRYGERCLSIDKQAIEDRSSVLECNSVLLADRYPSGSFHDSLPSGTMSIFEDRAKLAVAKIGCPPPNGPEGVSTPVITEENASDYQSNEALARLIMTDGSSCGEEDEYLEVLVYGKIEGKAFKPYGSSEQYPKTLDDDKIRRRKRKNDADQQLLS